METTKAEERTEPKPQQAGDKGGECMKLIEKALAHNAMEPSPDAFAQLAQETCIRALRRLVNLKKHWGAWQGVNAKTSTVLSLKC